MVYCVCVGLEAHIGHEHSRNGTRIHPVGLRLSEAETFPVEIGAQGIQDIGGQTVVKEKPQGIVAVGSGCLKSYLYFVLGCGTIPDFLQQEVKTLQRIWDGEHIREDLTF